MKLSKLKQAAGLNRYGEQLPTSRQREKLVEHFGIENLYQELEMDSPFVDTHVDASVSADEDYVHLHSHTFYELLCCRSGSIEYLLGTDRYRLTAGDIVFVPPSVSHRPIFPEMLPIPYRRYVLWFSQAFFEQMATNWPALREEMDRPGILRTAGTDWAYLQDSFRRGCEEAEKGAPGWQIWLYGNTMQLVTDLLRASRSDVLNPPVPEKRELVDHAALYVETHLAEKITLEGAAQDLLVSQSALQQTFRTKLGVSFYRFVTQRRLIAAKNRILEGQPLTSVGEMVGFSDYSTFYRAFQKEYGISPSQFRKMNSRSDQP